MEKGSSIPEVNCLTRCRRRNDVNCNRMERHDSRTTFMDDFPDCAWRNGRTATARWITLLSPIAFAQIVGYDRSAPPPCATHTIFCGNFSHFSAARFCR